MKYQHQKSTDIAILGSGYTGSLAAMILARKGYSVAVIDASDLPRFAIGESTTPEQNRVQTYLAKRYKLPELLAITSFTRMKKAALPIPSWPKEAFYFLCSHPTENQTVPEEVFHPTAPWPVGPDYHVSRADFDLYLLNSALSYGVKLYSCHSLVNVDFDENHVQCTLHDGYVEKHLHSRFFLDCTGHGAFLAKKFDIEAAHEDLPFASEAVFSHFLNVQHLEKDIYKNWKKYTIPRHYNTVHLTGAPGWVWVIPFDNGVTSVGVVLNKDAFAEPLPETDPTTLFWEMGRKFPAFNEIMQNAQPVRRYMRTGKMQRCIGQTVGKRWAILPPASGFLDPLFSTGMVLSAVSVGRLTENIDKVLHHGTQAEDALQTLNAFQNLEYPWIGRLLHCQFLSFHNFDMMLQSLALYRMLTLTYGMRTPYVSNLPELEPLMGVNSSWVQDLIASVHGELMEHHQTDSDAFQIASSISGILKKSDKYGFFGLKLLEPGTRGVYRGNFTEIRKYAISVALAEGRQSSWFSSILSKVIYQFLLKDEHQRKDIEAEKEIRKYSFSWQMSLWIRSIRAILVRNAGE